MWVREEVVEYGAEAHSDHEHHSQARVRHFVVVCASCVYITSLSSAIWKIDERKRNRALIEGEIYCWKKERDVKAGALIPGESFTLAFFI